ncbi:MAG: right-handed parallel beta-helix repeat-containing protein, partial [Promethearchaeota archaeon]
GSTIFINSNSDWNYEAETKPWCRGLGTIDYPYIIENVYIEGTGGGNLIEIRDTTVYFIIRNVTLINGGIGIYIYNSDNGLFDDIKCFGHSSHGIHFRYSENLELSNSFIEYCGGHGTDIYDCRSVRISKSNFTNNDRGINSFSSDYLNFSSNLLLENYYGIDCDIGENSSVSNNIVINSTSIGIYFEDYTNANITDNYVNNADLHGIGFYNVYNSRIMQNNVTNSDTGIHTSGSSGMNNIVFNNNVSLNGKGIYAYSSSTNIISNIVTENQEEGIYVSNFGAIVSDNYVAKNRLEGIEIVDSANSIFINNVIYDNRYDGIFVRSSNNLFFKNNSIDDNRDGMYFEICYNIIILENEIINNQRNGIRMNGQYYSWVCNDFNISENFISFNLENGIYLYECDNNNITNNSIIGNGNNWILNAGINTGNMIYNNYIDDEYERNDDVSNATRLYDFSSPQSHYYSDLISNSDDWYSFETLELLAIKVQIITIDNIYFELYSNTTILLAENSTIISDRLYYEPDYMGLFYLKIYGGFNSSYTLNITTSVIENQNDGPPDNTLENEIPGFLPIILINSLIIITSLKVKKTKEKQKRSSKEKL